MVAPNDLLRSARRAMLSPSGSQRPMSRQELADTCNAELAVRYADRGGKQRWAGITDRTIGALERGDIRWPNDDYRWALCRVLQADERSLGLYIDRPDRNEDSADKAGRTPQGAPWDVANESEPRQAGQPLDAFVSAEQWRVRLRNGLLNPTGVEVLPMQDLESALEQGNLAYQGARYSELHGLPILISAVESLFQDPPQTVGLPRVARAACGVYLLASKLAAKLGDGELAWTAADRARCFGLIAADPALIAIAAYQTACALAKQPGRAAEAEGVAVVAADVIASHKLHRTPAYLSAHGALLLHAALAAARQADGRGAWKHLRIAENAAMQLGRNSNELWTAFGQANVHLHRISVAVALHDNAKALRFADHLDVTQLPAALTSRRAQVHLDLAAAHGVTGSSDPQAMLQLLEYERLVPQAIKLNATAARLIITLMQRQRPSQTPGLRALAHRAGVQDS